MCRQTRLPTPELTPTSSWSWGKNDEWCMSHTGRSYPKQPTAAMNEYRASARRVACLKSCLCKKGALECTASCACVRVCVRENENYLIIELFALNWSDTVLFDP